jgi:predicted unusual protein kinase regulating ubiquinone biosynthesis (AarF/ABC1/UbiB family)
MVRQHHVRLEGDFVNVVISMLLLEGIGRSLNPDVDLLSSSLPILRQLGTQGGKDMVKEGDFHMLKVWVGLETRRFMQASAEDVSLLSRIILLETTPLTLENRSKDASATISSPRMSNRTRALRKASSMKLDTHGRDLDDNPSQLLFTSR